MLIEVALSYPDALYRAIGHPVGWIGRLISVLERALNRERWGDATRRLGGVATLVLVLAVTVAVALAIEAILHPLPAGFLWVGLAASSLIAQRSLHEHVAAVATALEAGGLEAGRAAVGRIVGRDTAVLDEAGVSRAAIESLAENFSDGIVAPVFWLGVGGLAGGAAYKAVNTADSMIGHRTDRYRSFGWAAARFDDLINLPASRLAALLLVLAAVLLPGASPAGAWKAVWRDASKHRSPNAGWPEAAMAGALGLALAGPRIYGGVEVQDVHMGDGRRTATAADIRRALALYRRADLILILLVAALAWFLSR